MKYKIYVSKYPKYVWCCIGKYLYFWMIISLLLNFLRSVFVWGYVLFKLRFLCGCFCLIETDFILQHRFILFSLLFLWLLWLLAILFQQQKQIPCEQCWETDIQRDRRWMCECMELFLVCLCSSNKDVFMHPDMEWFSSASVLPYVWTLKEIMPNKVGNLKNGSVFHLFFQ